MVFLVDCTGTGGLGGGKDWTMRGICDQTSFSPDGRMGGGGGNGLGLLDSSSGFEISSIGFGVICYTSILHTTYHL